MGHETIEAGDGIEALNILKDIKPDIILMDIRMPVMDGIEATKRIKKDPSLSEIPVVCLTASGTKEQRKCIEESGLFDYYILKPINIDEFINKIRSILKGGK